MQTFQQEQPLDFENLMERQRQLMKEMTSLSSQVANKSKLDNSNHTASTEESSSSSSQLDDVSAASSEKEDEWISNWQFERVPSNKKLMTTTTTTAVVETAAKANVVSPSAAPSTAAVSSSSSSKNDNNNTTTPEGGVFYFERILPAATDVTVSTAASASSSSPNYNLDNLTVEYNNNIGDHDDDDDDDMLFDMGLEDNDDLFADLESAAVVGTDDSEISLDDLMDMDVSAIDNHNKSKNGSSANNNYGDSSENDDMMMDDVEEDNEEEGGDDHRFYYTSPIASSSPSTPPHPLKTFSYQNSPTSTIMQPPFVVGSNNSSLRSATTRPALSEMRKIMNNFMNEDNDTTTTSTTTTLPSSLSLQQSQSQSRLPCARGMDGMYLDTLHKLHESMQRSKRTRQSLSIQTQHTQEYARNMCVSQIIQSVEDSSQQVDTCLQSVVVGMR